MPFNLPGMPQEVADRLVAQAQANKEKMMPRPAFTYPSVGRAVNNVEKDYPDLRGVPIKVNPWTHPTAGSNILASTSIPGLMKDHETESRISLNPALMAFPQEMMQNSLVHELQHVKQHNRSLANYGETGPLEMYNKQASLPYADRPSEKEAFAEEEKYGKSKGFPDVWHADTSVLNAFPRLVRR